MMQAVAIACLTALILVFFAHEIAQRKKRRLRSPGVFRGPNA